MTEDLSQTTNGDMQPKGTDEEEDVCPVNLPVCDQLVRKSSLVEFDGQHICHKCLEVLKHPDCNSGYPTDYLVATLPTDNEDNAKRQPPYNRRTPTTCAFSVHCRNKETGRTAYLYCFDQKKDGSDYCQKHGSFCCLYCNKTPAQCECHML